MKRFPHFFITFFFISTYLLGNDDLQNRKKIIEMFNDYKTEFPEVPNLMPNEIEKNGNAIILDVREDKEYEVSFIPNSINKKLFEQNINQYKDKTIFVYCTIGYRSGLYAKQLNQKGFKAHNMIGGILLWSHDIKVLHTKNNIPTKKVHVYGKKWNLAHSSFEPAW